MTHQTLIVLDFGSQYTQLIARALRELSVYSEIWPPDTPPSRFARASPRHHPVRRAEERVGQGAPVCDPALFDIGKPVLGICYGMQLMADVLGGRVAPAAQREYGHATVTITGRQPPSASGATPDRARRCSPTWLPRSASGRATAISSRPRRTASPSWRPAPTRRLRPWRIRARQLYALLFHPEVVHTEAGLDILRNFAYGVCGCTGDWTMASFVEEATARIRAQVGGGRVVCALSGGVDSTVAALIIHRAIGDKLTCIFVDNGVLRLNEAAQIRKRYERLQLPLVFADASALFLDRLAGITDPEQKRKIIGATFIDVFEQEAAKLGRVDFLAQGTLYPDVIESVAIVGQSAMIKSHHNVGGLPERMRMKLVEPLRELFKDEVRAVGRKLGLEEEFVVRQPFPGPGLAVRILGEVSAGAARSAAARGRDRGGGSAARGLVRAALAELRGPVAGAERGRHGRRADLRIHGGHPRSGEPGRHDGRLGAGFRTTCWRASPPVMVNEVKGINRVVYDISSKPPSTIEWE